MSKKKLVEIKEQETKITILLKTPGREDLVSSNVDDEEEPVQNAQKKGRAMQMWRVEVVDSAQVFNLKEAELRGREITVNGYAGEADK